MSSSVVTADGILMNRSQSLYYITDSVQYNPANFRIVELGASLQNVNLNNWHLLGIQNFPTNFTTDPLDRYIKWIPGQISIPWNISQGLNTSWVSTAYYNNRDGSSSMIMNNIQLDDMITGGGTVSINRPRGFVNNILIRWSDNIRIGPCPGQPNILVPTARVGLIFPTVDETRTQTQVQTNGTIAMWNNDSLFIVVNPQTSDYTFTLVNPSNTAWTQNKYWFRIATFSNTCLRLSLIHI